jgi:uncharacterized protein
MAVKKNVEIRCGAISLEGVLEIPGSAGGGLPGAVICHPHPLFGGDMRNNVVCALNDALLASGFACLRFNFRGTGASGGSHGHGVDELDDVRAALDFLEQQDHVDNGKMLVAGYSFGCWVGLHAASKDDRPRRLVGISPPLDMYDFGFMDHEKRPKFLIAGDHDFVCAKTLFESFASTIPEPKLTVVLHDADHFHFGRETELANHLQEFLAMFPIEK